MKLIQIVIKENCIAPQAKKNRNNYALDTMGKHRFGAVKDALRAPRSPVCYFPESTPETLISQFPAGKWAYFPVSR